MSSRAKVRVDITEDTSCEREGKRYKVTKWVFDRVTGQTVERYEYGTGLTIDEARCAKKHILEAYDS